MQIVETPLADVEVHDVDSYGSFSPSDRNYIDNAIVKGIYKKKLANIPFNLYLYILDIPGLENYAEEYPEGMLNSRNIEQIRHHSENSEVFEKVLQAIKLNQNKDPSGVHFIMGDNYSTEGQVPPTAWIIVHRLAHALSMGGIDRFLKSIPIEYLLGAETILTFKSARSGTLQNNEIETEIVTQYLMTGRIGIRKDYDDAMVARKIFSMIEKKIDQMLLTISGNIYYI